MRPFLTELYVYGFREYDRVSRCICLAVVDVAGVGRYHKSDSFAGLEGSRTSDHFETFWVLARG